MKKLYIMLILAISSLGIMANNGRQQEAGISFRNIDAFGLTYKTGTNSSLWRFSAFASTGSVSWMQDLPDHPLYNFSIYAAAGKEFRKPLTENMEARYGLDLSLGFNYHHQSNGDNDPFIVTQYQPGANLVLGLNYIINNRLVIGAELLPYASYYVEKLDRSSANQTRGVDARSQFAFGFTNTLTLSAAYRF